MAYPLIVIKGSLAMPIRIKVIIALSVMLLGMLLAGIASYASLGGQGARLTQAEQEARRMNDEIVPLMQIIGNLKLDIVQVQQFLTDASATHHEDSFQDAATWVKHFNDDIDKASVLARKLDAQDVQAELSALKSSFPAYYDLGVKMSRIYIDQGVEAGNVLMEDFDKKTDAMDKRSDALLEAMRKRLDTESSALVEAAGSTRERGEHAFQLIAVVFVVTICAGLVAAVSLGYVMSRAFSDLGVDLDTVMSEDKRPLLLKPERTDEFGKIAKALAVFREEQDLVQRMNQDSVSEHAAQARRAQEIERLAQDFNAMMAENLDSVTAALKGLQTAASSMSQNAETTTGLASAAAAAANQASTNVQTVAAAAEELSASVGEIKRQVEDSARIAADAVAEAGEANGKVRGLAEAASRIGDVVKLINDIASQTNLLALNATIEAARAGDAGKGFAVVAGEVKNLASQTAKATGEISGQIAAVQGATEDAVQAIEHISQTIQRIDEIGGLVSHAVDGQGMATVEIARNVQEAAAGTGEVTGNVDGVQTAATDTGHSAHGILVSVTELAGRCDALRQNVQTFLDAVRRA